MRVVVFVDEHDDRVSFLQRLAPVLPAGAEPHIVHIVNPLVDAADRFALSNAEAMQGLVAEWQQRLDELATALPGATTAVDTLQHGEDMSAGLLRVADASGAGLLALATRNAGTMRGMILGSIADAVLRGARVPVLIVHVE